MNDPDLTARLRAAINHRMELAKAAAPYWDHMYVGLTLERVDADYIEFIDAVRQHIDANGPARIIRDCEAHLRILDRHRPMTPKLNGQVIGPPWCWWCADGGKSDVDWPCDDILDLAHIYPDDLDQAADQPRPAATT